MSFVNEYISEADIKKYDIKELDRKWNKGHYKPDWTVDHDRNIYLRYIYNGREEFANRHTYCFYWKGTILMVQMDTKGGGVMNGEQWRHYKMWRMEIPEALKPHTVQIMNDLKEALITYKELGVLSESTKHTATFDF